MGLVIASDINDISSIGGSGSRPDHSYMFSTTHRYLASLAICSCIADLFFGVVCGKGHTYPP